MDPQANYSSNMSFSFLNIDFAGVIAKRILCLPLFNTDTNEVFGAVHIINKSQGRPNDAFTEVDEL